MYRELGLESQSDNHQVLEKLTTELEQLSARADGELLIYHGEDRWRLHIIRGKLLYAADELHPVRRLQRALKQHCPRWNWSTQSYHFSNDKFWQCHLLDQGIQQKQLSLIQAKLVIRSVLLECLFELSSYPDLKSDWKPSQKPIETLCQGAALSSWGMQAVFSQAKRMQQKEQAAGLVLINPSLAPILKQGVHLPKTQVFDKYLNGKFTLWDIALHLEKSVAEVTCCLLPLIDQKILEFQEIPDLTITTLKQPVETKHPPSEVRSTKNFEKQPLIACIDDSPVLAHSLKKILVPAGYQMLSIQEPMRGFAKLIEHKPDLILLDLLLPNADGYSICKFLRESSAFEKTPIIILTAKNTPIDRVRAKLVGATEFLSKPPQPQDLLQKVRQYIVQ
ncbi:MAG: response regulator [Symploca sp. SIO1C4]|uniref:Response regulator n=1 Tax=Symploca sp. SIO1C4 TaxID=2607765 RepID=A0A6B3NHV4_9CYAN|nr:response regulator [Symploca sp. SIO1C4]